MPATLDVPGVRPDEDWSPPLSWSLGNPTASLAALPDGGRRGDTGPSPYASAGDAGDPLLLQVCWPRLAGRSLLIVGGLLVAFAAFQVWGTSLIEWRTQRHLSVALATQLEPTAPLPLPGPATSPAPAPAPATTPAPAPAPAPAPVPTAAVIDGGPLPALAEGDVVGRIEIPAIGLSKVFLEGVSRDTLRRGPGLYPTTALPGHPGTTAMAGHRTTHGAPFFDLDRLEPGDPIVIETAQGRFEYLVEAQPGPGGTVLGHRIVSPDAIDVLADNGQNRLTLTACHPRYSAEQRIVVTALLVGPPLAAATTPAPLVATHPVATPSPTSEPRLRATSSPVPGPGRVGRAGGSVPRPAASAVETSLGWQKGELEPTLLWATITLLVSHGGWILARLWRPRLAWVVASPAVISCLFVCFTHVDRLIPAL